MVFSLAAAISLAYVLLAMLAITAAWKNWFGWGWRWIAGFVLMLALLPFVPVKQSASDEAAYMIENERAHAEARARNIPPRVEVDTGRDFNDATDRFDEVVQEQASQNEATQTPKGEG